jgi:alpha-beta hydrolase superfamily lysophospholipase
MRGAAASGATGVQPSAAWIYHEVLNEPEKDQVMARILAWLDKQRPAVSSSA